MLLSWHPGDLIDLPYFTEFSVLRYNPDSSDFGTSPNGVFYGEYFSSPGAGGSPGREAGALAEPVPAPGAGEGEEDRL